MTNKTLMLTGGAGFIGHHFVEHLLTHTEWDVWVIDRLTYAGDLNRITDTDGWKEHKNRVHIVYHDFRSNFEPVMKHLPPMNYIVHMGAESHVDKSLTDPALFAESNVLGTVNVLNLARVMQPEKMIYVSTDEVYGAVSQGHLHIEGEPYNPSNPYSASKAGAEAFCKAFHKSYDVPVLITNTMNNFGERQNPEKFIPHTIKQVLTNKEVVIHCKLDKDGKILDISSRCWLHARNHADGLLFLLDNGVPGQSYNIVGERHDVLDVAQFIGFMLNAEVKVKYEDFHSFRPGHDMHYGLDGGRMENMGWKPPISYRVSLKRTIAWSVMHPTWLG